MAILGIDAGTTGITALLVDSDRNVIGRGYQDFPQHFPNPGWVEHDPNEIWSALLNAVTQALGEQQLDIVEAIGLTNQRETLVLWDRETLGAPRKAIVWQDRRSSEICARLHQVDVSRTGLRMDPYFTATKALWLSENEPLTWERVVSGQVAIGTLDSYLIAKMTRGLEHLTDATNASRTLLYNLEAGKWDAELLQLFNVPSESLPSITSSFGVVAHTNPQAFLGLNVPIAGVAGDQQSALVSMAGFDPGAAACAYGTGSFLLINTGSRLPTPPNGLLATVAWQSPTGERSFALEGGIFVTGAAVQWLRDGLGIISNSAEIERLARSVSDSAGVILVPAHAGLGAPQWNPLARGAILGLSLNSTNAHIARALLEGIAHSIADIAEVMQVDVTKFGMHGGASRNTLLAQMQSTALGAMVHRRVDPEATALGAVELAARGIGWSQPTRMGITESISGPVPMLNRAAWKSAVAAIDSLARSQ